MILPLRPFTETKVVTVMDNAVRKDIALQDFSAGILRGIVAVTQDRGQLRAWRLDDPPAHAAASEVFRRLQKFHGHEYDLRFRIILGSDGRSWEWTKAIRDELYLYRTVQDLAGDGNFDILSGMNDLERWLRHDGAVGTADLWTRCGRRFIDEYTTFAE